MDEIWIGAELNNNEYIFILSKNHMHIRIDASASYRVYFILSFSEYLFIFFASSIECICVCVSMTWHKWAPNNLSSNLFIHFIRKHAQHNTTQHIKLNIEKKKAQEKQLQSNLIHTKHHLQSSIYSPLFHSTVSVFRFSFVLFSCNCKIKLSLIHFTIHWCVIVVVVCCWNEWMSKRKCGDDCFCLKWDDLRLYKCTRYTVTTSLFLYADEWV